MAALPPLRQPLGAGADRGRRGASSCRTLLRVSGVHTRRTALRTAARGHPENSGLGVAPPAPSTPSGLSADRTAPVSASCGRGAGPRAGQVGSLDSRLCSSAVLSSSSARPSCAALSTPSWYFSRAPFKARNISCGARRGGQACAASRGHGPRGPQCGSATAERPDARVCTRVRCRWNADPRAGRHVGKVAPNTGVRTPARVPGR